jgi:hypothetical protein
MCYPISNKRVMALSQRQPATQNAADAR